MSLGKRTHTTGLSIIQNSFIKFIRFFIKSDLAYKVLTIPELLNEICICLDDGVALIALAGTCKEIRKIMTQKFGEIRKSDYYFSHYTIGIYGRGLNYNKTELFGTKRGKYCEKEHHGTLIRHESRYILRETYRNGKVIETTYVNKVYWIKKIYWKGICEQSFFLIVFLICLVLYIVIILKIVYSCHHTIAKDVLTSASGFTSSAKEFLGLYL
jgi:hypothetical protein